MHLRKIDIGLFSLAFSLRLIWWILVMLVGSGNFAYYDSDQFILLADNLLEHGVFSRGAPDGAVGLFPDIARTPGYPAFLLPFRALGIPLSVIAFIQLTLGSLAPVWLYRSAEILKAPRKRLVAIIPIIDISLVMVTGTILSDGIFFTLLCFTIYTAVKELSRPGLPWLTTLLLVALIYVRPIAVFLMPVFALLYFIPPKGQQKRSVKTLIKGAFLFFVLFSLWPLRNYYHFGVFRYSSMSTNNLLLYNAAAAEARAEGADFTAVQHDLARQMLASQDWENDPMATKQYLDSCQHLAVSIFKEHPGEAAAVIAENLAGYFIKPPRSYFDLVFDTDFTYRPLSGFASSGSSLDKLRRYFSESHPSTLVLSLYALLVNLATLFLALRGMIYAWKYHRNTAIFLTLLLCYFWFLSVFTMTDARFRIPAIAALSLLAGFIPPNKKGLPEKEPS